MDMNSSVGAAGAPVSETGAQAGTAISTTSMSSSTTVSSEVESMLGGIDPALAGNEMLKMAITLLILEVLLGEDSEEKGAGALLLAALGGSNSQNSSAYFHSETTTRVESSSYGSQTSQSESTRPSGTGIDATA